MKKGRPENMPARQPRLYQIGESFFPTLCLEPQRHEHAMLHSDHPAFFAPSGFLMLFKAFSAAVYGIDAHIIDVEVDYSGAAYDKMIFATVGLPDAAVRESRDRVLSAIRNCGFDIPPTRITINLAPADLKKEGSGFDLPIAIGILGAYGALHIKDLSDFLLVGELGLDGTLRSVQGMLPIAIAARARGIHNLIIPAGNAREAAVVAGRARSTRSPACSRSATCSTPLPSAPLIQMPLRSSRPPTSSNELQHFPHDFKDVRGQTGRQARSRSRRRRRPQHPHDRPARLRQNHARQAPALHPRAPAFEEALETTKIHSVAGVLNADEGPGHPPPLPLPAPHHLRRRPHRRRRRPRPGEVSLAHNGLLFLDELPEFPRNVLEVLRQPLEDGHGHHLARRHVASAFPPASCSPPP